jgi:release factor glutamine methyltransferase
MTTVASVLMAATASLPGDEARAEAEILLGAVLGRTRAWLFGHLPDPIDPESASRFSALVERRRRGEPVAYLLGRRGFWSLDLAVSSDTLIPRPETELLVELALQRLPAGGAARILDLGTGSGAIALAIAHERPAADVTAVDIDARALAVARKNAGRLGLDRVRFLQSRWFSAVVDEAFDLIVANPPYLAEDDPHLREGDLRFEPDHALVSGPDGLDAIREIAAGASDRLRDGGSILIEHGHAQGSQVRELLAAAGLADVATVRDMEGRDRVSAGRKPERTA